MNQLKAGDILVFKAGDDWVGKAIAWLTESDVSHAAMMLNGTQMVEMSANGIYVGNAEAVEGDRAILLRLSPEKDAAPLSGAAQRYIDCKTRYDFPALVYLAGLIIYRRIRPTMKYVVITDLILREACVILDKLIQSVILKNPDKAMVCSQLVYQVYEDCGKEYHINIKNGLLQAGNDSDQSDGCICLADLAADAPGLDQAAVLNNSITVTDSEGSDSEVMTDVETLAKQLYQALTEEEPEDGMEFDAADLGNLPSWARCMLEKLEEFLEKSKSNLPIDALFISPADLAYQSTNLDTVGKMNIVRSK